VTLLGLKLNRHLRWVGHVEEMECELSKRISVLHRLRQFIPQNTLVSVMNGFFISKATYLLDILSDSTGDKPGSETSVEKLQVKLNDAIRCVLKIPKKNHVGRCKLHARTGLPCIKDLAIRAECSMAWRLLADEGNMRDIAEPQLRLQEHGYSTRSQGKLVQEDKYPSFIKKIAKLFNLFDEKLKRSDNKEQAKKYIRSSLQIIRSGLASL
jgi:hypothetical protein